MFVFQTGRGGASIFGKQFEDELRPELKFTGNARRRSFYRLIKTGSGANPSNHLCVSVLMS